MPWLSQKSHVTNRRMSATTKNLALLTGLSLMFLPAALSNHSIASEKTADRTNNKTKKQSVKASGDQFQLTLSKVPYSTDPNSDYVRIYCAPGKKHPKTN